MWTPRVRGEDAETMSARVKKRGRTVVVEVVNKYSRDVLTYGRARKANDRAMTMPAVLRKAAELFTGEKLGDDVVFASAEVAPMGGANLH